jgi:acyl-CoA synthetase (AMP-forming)/AMP-acid ligase II
MTEAPGEIASQAPDRDRRPGTVGKPTLCDVEIRSEGKLLPAGRSGEIWIRGPNVVSAGVPAGQAWVPTKDIGWLDGDGFLRVTGRVDDIINSGGLKIWPPDVEMAARADPVVATAVAFPIPHPAMGETVGLAVIPVPGRAVDRTALRRRLMAALPRSAWPSTIVVCAEIPRSARGKISRRSLWLQLADVRARIRT